MVDAGRRRRRPHRSAVRRGGGRLSRRPGDGPGEHGRPRSCWPRWLTRTLCRRAGLPAACSPRSTRRRRGRRRPRPPVGRVLVVCGERRPGGRGRASCSTSASTTIRTPLSRSPACALQRRVRPDRQGALRTGVVTGEEPPSPEPPPRRRRATSRRPTLCCRQPGGRGVASVVLARAGPDGEARQAVTRAARPCIPRSASSSSRLPAAGLFPTASSSSILAPAHRPNQEVIVRKRVFFLTRLKPGVDPDDVRALPARRRLPADPGAAAGFLLPGDPDRGHGRSARAIRPTSTSRSSTSTTTRPTSPRSEPVAAGRRPDRASLQLRRRQDGARAVRRDRRVGPPGGRAPSAESGNGPGRSSPAWLRPGRSGT